MNGAEQNTSAAQTTRQRRGTTEFSYKFQRLRERIRQAVANGELTGKLPGERELARRFQVNAKTLSKALTDLAAEGLLSRSIGRGSFVKGSTVAPVERVGKWMLIADASTPAVLVNALAACNADHDLVPDVSNLRPSFLNQFSAIIDLSASTPPEFIRDMLVRNLPVVLVGREPSTYATNAVLLDVSYLAGRLGRELILAGHRRFAAVRNHAPNLIEQEGAAARSLRFAAGRYAPDAVIHSCLTREIVGLVVDRAVTAVVCESADDCRTVSTLLAEAAIPVPNVVSVVGMGFSEPDVPCTGFFLTPQEVAEAVNHLLQSSRKGGAALWLTGKYIDRGTTGAASAGPEDIAPILTLTA